MKNVKVLHACLNLLFGLLIGVASNESARAQSVYGAISGLITDSSSAIVANAKVTLVNEGTGIQRSVLSNNTGEYVFSQVIPGAYSIGLDAPGFKTVYRKNLTFAQH